MELKNISKMNKIAFFIAVLCAFTSCSKDSEDSASGVDYGYYYPMLDATITSSQIGDGTGKLDPKGIAIANDKLYVCNGDQLDIFNAQTLVFEKTIRKYIKGTTTIDFTKLSSISIEEGRIYLGSVDSRVFILDEKTTGGISTLGNGQWWTTFVHVFGVVVRDGLVFVKEKETTVKVFEVSQITETSNWNLAPIAKLNTVSGFDEIYSMDVSNGNLVIAGRDAKSFLYYKIADIRANGAASLSTPMSPTKAALGDNRPTSLNFSTDWAMTSENIGNVNYVRLYSKEDFLNKNYNSIVSSSDILGKEKFGTIYSVAQLDDRLFISDNSNQKIKVIKLKKASIIEQK